MIDLEAAIVNWAMAVSGEGSDQVSSQGYGHVLRPPASEAALSAAEARLGVGLPSSYRRFLARSNGATVGSEGGEICRLLPIEEVLWLRDSFPAWVEAWSIPELEDNNRHPLPGKPIDVDFFQPAADALQISERLDLIMDLLVPVRGSSEWECWQTFKEGATAHSSFIDMLQWQADIITSRRSST